MRWDMTSPCADCPFLRVGGIRLTSGRVEEIAGDMLSSQGHTFACHQTTGVKGNRPAGGQQHCAGALIFAEKNENATQAMRIAERLDLYDHKKLVGAERVFDTLEEMLSTAWDRQK